MPVNLALSVTIRSW